MQNPGCPAKKKKKKVTHLEKNSVLMIKKQLNNHISLIVPQILILQVIACIFYLLYDQF